MSWRTVYISMAGCLCCVLARGQEESIPVRLTIVETEAGPPLPCRIHLRDSREAPVQPSGLPFWKDHFVCPGEVSLRLAPGNYSYEIERGPEYFTATGKLAISASSAARSITNRLRRLSHLAKEGWWSGELHVHRPVSDIELLMRAEDLHVAPVITWWNDFNVWTRQPPPTAALTRFDGDRFYHVMAGEDERNGGALLFFNLERPLDLAGAKREYPSPMKFLEQARQNASVWVDLEKPFWYDTPVWIASGMVDSVGLANNHMQRSGMLANEAWGRARDKQRLPDPKGNGFWTQELYYHALNCGFRLPPSAGSASGVLSNPVGYNRVYVHVEGKLSYENWWAGLGNGRVFVSNGPLLRCRTNGKLPGHVFTAPAGGEIKLQIEAALDSRDPVPAIEIIRNGHVDRVIPFADWTRTGSLGELVFKESGWFLVRAIADVPHTLRFASTGPFYVEIGTVPRRISKTSAQFFLDWVRERIDRIKLDDPEQRAEVLIPHQVAEKFWQEKVAHANAD